MSMKSGKYKNDCNALEEYSIPYSSFLTPSPIKNKTPSDAKENLPFQKFSYPFAKGRLKSLSETDEDEDDDDPSEIIDSASIASLLKEGCLHILGRSANAQSRQRLTSMGLTNSSQSGENKREQNVEPSIIASVLAEKSDQNQRVESSDPVVCGTNLIVPTNQAEDVTSVGVTGIVDIAMCDSAESSSSPQSNTTTSTQSKSEKEGGSGNSMDDEGSETSSNNIRRSWSHIEVRTIKGLFQRKRSSTSDVKRRNSYAYQTSSLKTNQQIAAESEIRVLNHVVGNPDDRKSKKKGGNKKNKRKNERDDNGDGIGGPNFTKISNNPPQLPLDIFEFVSVNKDVLRVVQLRRFTINEIYSTEKSYMGHMRTFKKVFIDPFIEASKNPNPLVNSLDIPLIFAHVDGLIRLSTRMVESFESNASLREDSELKICEVFLKHHQEFEVFRQYAENHQRSVTAVKRANENVLYRKFIQRSLQKQETNRLGLSDYMIMPIQRVMRYCLLLKELKKYTPESHADYEGLCKALDNMISLAKECDNTIQKL